MVANFGGEAAEQSLGDRERTLWSSPSAESRDGSVRLPAWSAVVLKTDG
jgi:hypothetical protein